MAAHTPKNKVAIQQGQQPILEQIWVQDYLDFVHDIVGIENVRYFELNESLKFYLKKKVILWCS
jgi:hypothetical protein